MDIEDISLGDTKVNEAMTDLWNSGLNVKVAHVFVVAELEVLPLLLDNLLAINNLNTVWRLLYKNILGNGQSAHTTFSRAQQAKISTEPTP